ncbi:sensor histidine kinase [Natronomonas sp. EA1]|uniref:sensor histidine kinase n=1 Tax=Natronomonas sp. EA1 TaxID=3421655 RepID=UPI003EB9B865
MRGISGVTDRGACLGLIAFGFALTTAVFAFGTTASRYAFLLEGVDALFGVLVIAAGGLLLLTPTYRRYAHRVLGWSVLVAAKTGVVGWLAVAYQLESGVPLVDVPLIYLSATNTGALTGVVLGFYDVRGNLTRDSLERRERALRERNARLDRFAAVVAHDIRNPLNIADGYLELAREGDATAFDRIERAHDRMDAITNGLLSIARTREVVLEPVDVGEEALAAWGRLEAPTAQFLLRGTRRIEADPDALAVLFETVFQNMLTAGDDIAIELGVLDDGFYIADDGPGLAPTARDGVLTYATDEAGIGLAVVSEVARAHGWEVTPSDRDGARIEITGVTTPPASTDA